MGAAVRAFMGLRLRTKLRNTSLTTKRGTAHTHDDDDADADHLFVVLPLIV